MPRKREQRLRRELARERRAHLATKRDLLRTTHIATAAVAYVNAIETPNLKEPHYIANQRDRLRALVLESQGQRRSWRSAA